MLYTLFTVKGKDYKCRLTAQSIIDVEKKLDKNILQVLVDMEQSGQMPCLQPLLTILHASLQKFHHNMDFDNVAKLYDDYAEELIENNSSEPAINGLVKLIYQIFVDSGLLPKSEDVKEDNGKN